MTETTLHLQINGPFFKTEIEVDASNSNNDLAKVRCADDKFVTFAKSELKKFPFIEEAGDALSFDFSSEVLDNLIKWSFNYSFDGEAASKFTRPCIFVDFAYLASNEWDKKYFELITSEKRLMHFVSTLNAAEKYKMNGLVDFLCIVFSCKLRAHIDDGKAMLGIPKGIEFSEEDLQKVSDDYSWFDAAVKPKIPEN